MMFVFLVLILSIQNVNCGWWSEWKGRYNGTYYALNSSVSGDMSSEICVREDSYIRAIKATFSSGVTKGWFGDRYNVVFIISWFTLFVCYHEYRLLTPHYYWCILSAGSESCFELSDDESGFIIDALQFTTSYGNIYGALEDRGGAVSNITGDDGYCLLEITVIVGNALTIDGGVGMYINQIQFYFDLVTERPTVNTTNQRMLYLEEKRRTV